MLYHKNILLHTKNFDFAVIPFNRAVLPMLSLWPHRRRKDARTPGLVTAALWLRLTPGESKSYKEGVFESPSWRLKIQMKDLSYIEISVGF